MTETLFSLEVHVESLEDFRVACKLPALCFRLLDFPTMIIHHVSPVDAEKIRQRLRMEGKDSALHELKDRFGNFQLRKGKSCLFKASIGTLLVQLQTVPLYAMLMDLWPKKPILVGSTLIPLKNAIDKISTDVHQKGVAVPSFYRDEGDFAVYNLMGSSIAKAKLGFRLLSLGGSLIPHIPTEALGNRITEKVETSKQVERAVKGALEKVLPETESISALTENELNTESESNAEIVTVSKRSDIKHSVEVQTNLHARTIKTAGTLDHQRKKSEEDVVITNTVCPPPLYYNYFSNPMPSSRPNPVSRGEGTQNNSSDNDEVRCRQAFGKDESTDVDFIYYDPGVVQADGTVGLASVSVQTDENLSKPSLGHQSNHVQTGFVDGLYNLQGVTLDAHLPILNALLQELSCLNRRQQIADTSHPMSLSAHSQTTAGKKLPSSADRGLKQVPKGETYRKQTDQAKSPKKTQTSVIGLPRRRVRFKQTSLTYGMTKTQKMRLEINQKEKLLNRSRPCEEHRALAEKEKVKGDSAQQRPSSVGGLGMTYKIGSARRQTGREVKHTADVQIQTEQLSTEGPHQEKSGISGTTWVVKESTVKPDTESALPNADSARSLKSQNSLEIFIPQVEGELEERSDQEKEWTTDQPTAGFYGNTGILSAELDDVRAGSAMTMYTEDFEDSGTEGSQASYHLAFTRSNSVDNENLKQRSNSEDSSASHHSQGSSVASGRPVRSSRSPVKAKSKRTQARSEGAVNVEQPVTTSQQDSAGRSSHETNTSSGTTKDFNEGSEASYSDDFHSVDSKPENKYADSISDDSVDDNYQQAKLDLPPPASNLGYTY